MRAPLSFSPAFVTLIFAAAPLLATSPRSAVAQAVATAAPTARAASPDPRPAVGSILGRVRLPGGASAGVTRLSPYNRQSYGAAPPQVRTVDMADVAIWVPTASTTPGAGSPPRAMVDQRDMEIVPRVAVVTVGTTVDFPNNDEIFHNLFSLSPAKKFNLGRYAPGASRSVVFDREGEVQVFCDIHSDMVGSVLVVGTRAFARPAADGSYRIDGLAAGRHSVVVWHPTLGADTVSVDVRDGGDVTLDLDLR